MTCPIIAKHVRGALGRPFSFGECAPWANGLVLDLTGDDLLSDCPECTDKTVRRMGIYLARAARKNGWRSVSPEEAPAGAVGVIRSDAGHTAAVADGAGRFLARSGRGVAALPASYVRFAWSIR